MDFFGPACTFSHSYLVAAGIPGKLDGEFVVAECCSASARVMLPTPPGILIDSEYTNQQFEQGGLRAS